jgi:endonuclease/exonuclease/phosphatase (EEP) superfamily protein YafD
VVELLDDSKLPTFLVGDLNARPNAPEIATLTKVWRDTWAEVGAGPGYSSPAENPTARIDYLLHTRQTIEPLSSAVIATNGSDHLPVVATYNLR